MLRLIDLTLAQGSVPLIERATLTINPGRKVGIVGANGAGKSTLFAALRGLLTAERGDISMPNGWVIAHVAQETPPSALTALEYALDGDTELRSIEAALAVETETPNADPTKHGEILAHWYEQMEHVGGYAAPARAAELLAGLGFENEMQSRAVATFSGGWRMRLNLAQALMCRSDLLLLDEPTNHLDLDAVMWIEDWLSRYAGTLMVITHDRDFIDRVSDQILYFDTSNPKAPAKLKLYTGNYSSFEDQRTVELSVQQGAFEKQQRTIKHLESFITRFKAKATKAAQAQSRVKALEKLERISAAHVDSPFTFGFKKPEGEPRQLLKFADVSLGYGTDRDKNILTDVSFSLLPNSRIGLLGKNGAGKSTLVKAIAGELSERTGERIEGQHLKIAYFAQHQLEQLRNDESALWHLDQLDKMLSETRGYPRAREQEQRNFLGGFDFRGDRVTEKVGVFSGGERARLVLALLVYERPNLLLLDEPTNHLDMEMRQALTLALQDYEGALVVVAHDRHILRACCDELWLVADGTAKPFDGDLDDYRDWLREQRVKPAKPAKAKATQSSKAVVEAVTQQEDKRVDAEERQRLAAARRPMQKRIDSIEKELAKFSATRDSLDAWLASELAYAADEASTLGDKTRQRGELAAKIASLEEEWMQKQEEMQWVR